MFKLAQTFYHSMMPAVIKPLHILWNEIIGFFFLVIAVGAFGGCVRYYRQLAEDPNNLFRLALSVLFGVMMVWFGVGSFLKARQIRRRGAAIQHR